MKYVFGPVPSRRLGQSLGIDPIPFKTCNWNCVYCQLGRTSPLTSERREFFPPDEIISEVQSAVKGHKPGSIDWLTFVGSGEPTLHASLGEMIRRLKSLTPIPIAVITNGSLLHLPQVRGDLSLADAVLPTLDAGSNSLYRRINRPTADLSFDQFVSGLIDFRKDYHGDLWIEVMLIKGLNDTEEALRDLTTVLEKIQPDEVHINLPVRPPCEPWVQPTDEAGQNRAAAILGDVARIVQAPHGQFDLSGYDNVVDAVIAVIKRHPMREEELMHTLKRWSSGEVIAALRELRRSGQAQVVTRHDQRFWSCSEARYVDEELSRCHRERQT